MSQRWQLLRSMNSTLSVSNSALHHELLGTVRLGNAIVYSTKITFSCLLSAILLVILIVNIHNSKNRYFRIRNTYSELCSTEREQTVICTDRVTTQAALGNTK